jgi:hypothetical protein
MVIMLNTMVKRGGSKIMTRIVTREKMTEARKEARRFLAEVPSNSVLRCCNGHVVKDMNGLKEALIMLAYDINMFKVHVNERKNDFSDWVRDAIGDKKLSKDLEKATSPSLAAWQVGQRINVLKKLIAQANTGG